MAFAITPLDITQVFHENSRMPLSLRDRFLNVPNYITFGRLLAVPILMVVMLWMEGPAMSYTAASIFILAIIILGGLANLKGPILGALFLILLPEVLWVI